MDLITGAIARYARETPARIAITCAGEATTFAILHARATHLAGHLGDRRHAVHRIGLIARNEGAFYELLLASLHAGAVFIPINWRLSPAEIGSVLVDAQPTWLFVEREFRMKFADELHDLGAAVCIVDMDVGWRSRLKGFEQASDPRRLAPSDTVWQIYTSGTTGTPKGAEHSLYGATCGVEAGIAAKKLSAEDVCLAVLPQFHVGGIMSGIQTLCAGGRVAVLRETEPNSILAEVQRERVTLCFVVPTLLHALTVAAENRGYDTSSLRDVYYAGAPMPRAILDRARRIIPANYIQLYGMTETLGMISYFDPTLHANDDRLVDSVGRPYPKTEVAILDRNGHSLPSDTVGEIACRSPFVMKGYWQRPQETSESFLDGWLRTGDLGMVDEAGFLFLQDRLKDLIITGGENVYPGEIEEALYSHRDVQEAAVIGVPDAYWGEIVAAFVVLQPDSAIDDEALIDHLRQRIAGYKLPKRLQFVGSLPRNPSGKILRREIRRIYLEGGYRKHPTVDSR